MSFILLLFHSALFYFDVFYFLAPIDEICSTCRLSRPPGQFLLPLLDCYSAVFRSRKNVAYQNVAFLSQILGDSSVGGPHSFRMLAFHCHVRALSRNSFAQLARRRLHHDALRTDSITLCILLLSRSFIFDDVEYYSAVMRVQYCRRANNNVERMFITDDICKV